MRHGGSNPETDPAHTRFNALVTARSLTKSIEMMNTPQGLIAYWNQEKNRKRLTHPLMPAKWAEELEQRFQNRLEKLNDAGPDTP